MLVFSSILIALRNLIRFKGSRMLTGEFRLHIQLHMLYSIVMGISSRQVIQLRNLE